MNNVFISDTRKFSVSPTIGHAIRTMRPHIPFEVKLDNNDYIISCDQFEKICQIAEAQNHWSLTVLVDYQKTQTLYGMENRYV